MKYPIKIPSFVLLFVAACAPGLRGSVEVRTDLVSRYIWRGFDVLADTGPALQPDAFFDLGESGLWLDLWGSFSLSDRARLRELDELDVTLAYDLPLGTSAVLQTGLIHYVWFSEPGFSLKDSTTLELFLAASLPAVTLEPTLTVYYDVHQGKGVYIQAGISKTWPLSPAVALEWTGRLGYNGGQWIDDSGISDLQMGLALPVSLSGLELSAFMNYTFVFLDSVNEGDEIWFGLSLGADF